MLKSQYGIFKYPDGDIRLSIKFLDENYQTLGRNMLNIDIGKEETEVYYQMDDESLGGALLYFNWWTI